MTSVLNKALNTVRDKTLESEPARIPSIHNFTFGMWGHAMGAADSMGDGKISFMGHSQNDIQEGDYLLLQDAKDRHTARYRVTKVKCCYNPPDLYSGEAVFQQRTEKQFSRDAVEMVKMGSFKWSDA
jgi:hypothetical protein